MMTDTKLQREALEHASTYCSDSLRALQDKLTRLDEQRWGLFVALKPMATALEE